MFTMADFPTPLEPRTTILKDAEDDSFSFLFGDIFSVFKNKKIGILCFFT